MGGIFIAKDQAMRRIWLDIGPNDETELRLEGDSFHHAIQVSRFSVSDQFEIVSGQQEALVVEVKEIKKKQAVLKVLSRRLLARPHDRRIHLAFGLSRWNIFEEVIEKSVELGVATLRPLVTDYSFIKKANEITAERKDRWKKIAQSATAQSARGSLMSILEPLSLSEFIKEINQVDKAPCLFAFEGLTLRGQLLNQIKIIKDQAAKDTWALVGSEGGFSAREVELLKAANIMPVSLGDQILRAETACFTLLSVLKYELQLME